MPTRMKLHLQTDHPLRINDSADQFRQKKARFATAGKLTTGHGFVQTQKLALEASYCVAYRIAKVKKPHTIGETLIKPCALEMVQLMCGEQHCKGLETIPLSDNVIKRRIDDIADDILISEIKASLYKISVKLDESTDCAQCSQLLVFVRYMHECDIKEEFLFSEPLVTTTKATDVLDLVTTFMDKHNIPMDKLGSMCTDGAPAMLGNKSGFCALVKSIS
ncbi:PREDICTED: protein ZBED8-like isoform X5 [Priapulus caudatus]|uniref:Protein ZBED8-like isoform X4 n=1 Tax=Priapulus caudatus TaxID=37621 RepID=A0ABM1E533_PRICU|nr:PREDICTED: protein ZBED8-like isoform X4 [Priapulus caudatus]XP_014667305.1 PREDICTED: protein ZBED8-like isoform X5 [Priapulus caudatus]